MPESHTARIDIGMAVSMACPIFKASPVIKQGPGTFLSRGPGIPKSYRRSSALFAEVQFIRKINTT
jgi:hypothetical protein